MIPESGGEFFRLREQMRNLHAYIIAKTAKPDTRLGWQLSCAFSVSAVNMQPEGRRIPD